MKKVLFPHLVICVLLLILSCVTTGEKKLINEGHQALNGDQIMNLLSGNTLKGVENGTSWAVYYSPDGTQYGRYGSRTDIGKWWVSDNQYCRQWNTWSDHKIKCQKIYVVGDKLVWVLDGKVADESVMPVAGDIENLK